MSGLLLDKRASLWRKVSTGSAYVDTQVYASISFAVVAISKLDRTMPYAFEASHVLWVPYWLDVRKEDQIRYGRRLSDAFNSPAQPYIYVVNGKTGYSQGPPQISFYCTERE